VFGLSNLYIYGAIALVLAGLVGTTYVYKLKFDKAQILQQVAEQQRDTMLKVNEQILEAQAADAKIRDKLYEDFKGARNEAETYRQKLADHDLSALAAAKPGLVTRLARRATDRVLRDIEAAANGGPTETVPESADSGHSETENPPTDSHSD
jgi:hypothetical protein